MTFLAGRGGRAAPSVTAELLEVHVLGRPVVIAMIGIPGYDRALTWMVPSGSARPAGAPPSPLHALGMRPRWPLPIPRKWVH